MEKLSRGRGAADQGPGELRKPQEVLRAQLFTFTPSLVWFNANNTVTSSYCHSAPF